MKSNKSSYLLSVIVLAALTACGGGGGGTTVVNTPAPAPAPAPGPGPTTPLTGTLVTSVTAPAYAAVSEELAAFNLLNAERGQCGFGLLAQNTLLDTSAKNHADWMLINNYVGHIEDGAAAPQGFTGITPPDRTTAAGYSAAAANVSETLAEDVGITSIVGYGASSVRGLLSAPYHLMGMMAPYKDVGVSIRSRDSVTSLVPNGLSRAAAFNYGVATGNDYQLADSSAVSTYPCAGVTGVNYRLRGEAPNPVPGRDLAANPLGHPILVMARKGQTLVITSASMVDMSTGLNVALRPPVMASNDSNFGVNDGYMGYVIPDAALTQNTSYQATVNGTNNGVAFSRTFTFSTGSGG